MLVLGKRLDQPGAFRPWGRAPGADRIDTWAVREDAADVDEVVEDAADTLVATCLPVLAELGSPLGAYTRLLDRSEPEPEHGVPSVHAGVPGSPRWLHTVRWLAGVLGRDADRDIPASAALRTIPDRVIPR